MCPNKFSNKKIKEVGAPSTLSGRNNVLQHDVPVFRENPSGCYIEFRAFDPEQGKMRRCRIKINRIKGAMARRKYAKETIARLVEELEQGWNPWIIGNVESHYTIREAFERYENYLEKMNCDGLYRKETYAGYKSYFKILCDYIERVKPIHYLYQLNRKYVSGFLDYVYIERGVGAQTRNNYLVFLKVLSGFFVEKGLLDKRPTEGIAAISKRLYKKGRTEIPLEKVKEINEYLSKNDPHFLLACYILYYCFIRPVEMTRLQVKHINVRNNTIFIPGECSKNHEDQTVTLPKKVLLHAIDLGVLSAPMNDYIFSTGLRPGKEMIDTKIFRDHWAKVKKALRLKPEWKFYSLKDTGITEMCDNNMPAIAVRDQARHSSLAITDMYTRHRGQANADIVNIQGSM